MSKLIDNDWYCTCPTLHKVDGDTNQTAHFKCAVCGTIYFVINEEWLLSPAPTDAELEALDPDMSTLPRC